MSESNDSGLIPNHRAMLDQTAAANKIAIVGSDFTSIDAEPPPRLPIFTVCSPFVHLPAVVLVEYTWAVWLDRVYSP